MINAPYLEKRHWAKVQWSSSCPVTLGDSCGMGKRVPGSLKLSCPSPASSSLLLHSSASCCCVRSGWRGSDGLQHKVGKTEQKWLKLSRFLSLPSFLWFVRKKVNIQGFSCELLWKVERILCSVKTPSKANAPVSTFTLLRGIPSCTVVHTDVECGEAPTWLAPEQAGRTNGEDQMFPVEGTAGSLQSSCGFMESRRWTAWTKWKETIFSVLMSRLSFNWKWKNKNSLIQKNSLKWAQYCSFFEVMWHN